MRGNRWLLSLLLFASASALGATYRVGIGDDFCASRTGCFYPDQLTIHVGDTVTFFNYAEMGWTGAHNVVADDGSFRCAHGCDGEGGDGTPGSGNRCYPDGSCSYDGATQWLFSRQFNETGVVKYHDEVSGTSGVVIVVPEGAPTFAIGPGITGTWFNPAQPGHAIMLEVLPGEPMNLLATWFTYAPQGGQSWILGLGPINGATATMDGMQTGGAGARFPPNLDASKIQNTYWGSLTFRFSDCSHVHVDWSESGWGLEWTPASGYGSGGMDLTRLTLPAGLNCPN